MLKTYRTCRKNRKMLRLSKIMENVEKIFKKSENVDLYIIFTEDVLRVSAHCAALCVFKVIVYYVFIINLASFYIYTFLKKVLKNLFLCTLYATKTYTLYTIKTHTLYTTKIYTLCHQNIHTLRHKTHTHVLR